MRRRRNKKNPAQPQEPQAWITLMWHMRLRLPWCWRLGPSNASERQHAEEMVENERFPTQTLFCGDALRWGIEVEFRGLKQTLDRSKLRCRNDRRLLAELDWSILALSIAEILALKEQLLRKSCPSERRRVADPAKRSLTQTMRALRNGLRDLHATPPPGQDLLSLLHRAVTDSYHRRSSKRARYRPPNPDKKALGDPKLRRPNKTENEELVLFAPGKAG